jgi:hypothetical protein
MPAFVFEANIAHYKKLLESETDPEKCARVRQLLAEEEAKLADYHANKTDPEK